MEIIEKSNLKTKALVIILIATLLLGVSTLFCTVKAADEETVEPRINTKIEFTGKTYKYRNQDKVRKEYAEGEIGSGIVSMVLKNSKHPVCVIGEGWIDINQIVKSEEYITLKFDTDDLKENGVKSTLTVNGEFLNIESENNGIIEFKDGALEAKANGKTTLVFIPKEGEAIEVLATVVDGAVTLNIPEKSISGEITAKTEIADKVKIDVEATGDATAAIVIDEKGISVAGEGEGEIKLKVNDEEIASGNATANGTVTVDEEGAKAEGESKQSMNLFQKLTMKLAERLALEVNKEEAKVSAGGDVAVIDQNGTEQEIASGDAEMSYNYSDEDPKADLKVEVLDKEVANVEDQTVPVISLFKKLVEKVQAR